MNDTLLKSTTLAVTRNQHTPKRLNSAEIIDLVKLPDGARPTPLAYIDYEEVMRVRQMGCLEYDECLKFAAGVRWKSFHCRQCPKNPEQLHGSPATEIVEPSISNGELVPFKE